MIYLLKFGASFVLPPGIFIVVFFLLAVYCWNHVKKNIAVIIFAITFVLYLASTGWIAEKLVSNLENVYNPPVYPTGDAIIMLGGGATLDTPDVSGTGQLCSVPANRLLTAVRLQERLGVPILVSGGQAYEDSGKEAVIARRILMDLGVPKQKILVEDKSLNTKQNAVFSAKILAAHDLVEPLLVTSAFHMRRAVLNFKQEGIHVTPYPTDYIENKKRVFHYTKLAPSANALADTEMALQENLRFWVTKYLKY
ncbi:YdcF family protein [Pectinatus sottacetonis]|uniref:YdcF family protein n=1 Tax=Pectinatus sottacetonis TaxID=1002795 RepID=UPI0018C85108|nr:YdcF family protein [Pectinatus sottacetonis]